MKLENLLDPKKDVILKKWFDLVMKTYPEDTAKFFIRKKDAFANPVGSTVYQGLKALLQELVGGMDHQTLKSFLDPIVRIRAVQGFSPSDALSFIFSLKTIIRDLFAEEIRINPDFARALLAFETDIDTLSLIAFDRYSACREKIYELKANEVGHRAIRALKKAKLVTDHQPD